MKSADYSLLMMWPDAERVDVLCVGAVVRDAEGLWHVLTLPTADKLAAVAPADPERLPRLARNLRQYLAECDSLAAAREQLARARSTLALHEFEGFFAYDSQAQFGAQLRAIMQESVLPPAVQSGDAVVSAVHKVRPHTRARLRRQFETMGILARHAGEIGEHKVVRNYPVSLRHGLTAEFALKNAAMHITETVDFEVGDDSVRGKTFEAQAKCLVLRAAREAFGQATQCYVVVSGGAAAHAARSVDLLSSAGRLFAAESADDMAAYLDIIARAARSTGQLGA